MFHLNVFTCLWRGRDCWVLSEADTKPTNNFKTLLGKKQLAQQKNEANMDCAGMVIIFWWSAQIRLLFNPQVGVGTAPTYPGSGVPPPSPWRVAVIKARKTWRVLISP